MKRFALLLAAPLSAISADFADCLFDNLPGIKSDVAAKQQIAACLKEYPGSYASIEKRSGWFVRYPDGRSCTIAKAKDTISPFAAASLQRACYVAYEPPKFDTPAQSIDDFLKQR